jgi:uncharacterized protein YciU (UPF0263 family)
MERELSEEIGIDGLPEAADPWQEPTNLSLMGEILHLVEIRVKGSECSNLSESFVEILLSYPTNHHECVSVQKKKKKKKKRTHSD